MEAPNPEGRVVTPSIGWLRDLAGEQYVENELGLDWSYLAHQDIGHLKLRPSFQLQARIDEHFDPSLLEEYTEAMERGAAFPSPWVFLEADGSYLIGSGIHRTESARRAGRTHIDVYVLRVTDRALQQVIAQNFNRLVGKRPPRDHRIRQAIEYFFQSGRNIKATASYYGISESTLAAALRVRDIDGRLKRVDLDPERFGKTAKDKLSALRLDSVLQEVGRVHLEARLPSRELGDLVSQVRVEPSEVGQLSIVEQFRGRDDVKARMVELRKGLGAQTATRAQHRADLKRALTAANTLIDRYPTRTALQLGEDRDYHDAVARAERVYRRLANLGV